MVYTNRDFDNANNVFGTLQKASAVFGINVNEPAWVEIPSNKPQEFIAGIKANVNPKDIKIILVIIPNA